MHYLILIITTLAIFPQKQNFKPNPKQYLTIEMRTKGLSKQNVNLYHSILSGNKKLLSKKTLNLFKRYGLLHLLTPSGLHLSGLIFCTLFFTLKWRLLLITFLYLFIEPLNTYYSIERILIFQLILLISQLLRLKLKANIVFLLCMLAAIILGNYSKSPLSYFFSFLFWGTIFCFKDNKRQLILFLFISLTLSNTLMQQKTSLYSLAINPILTSYFTCIFPIMVVNYLLGGIEILNYIVDLLLNIFWGCLRFTSQFDIFPGLDIPILIIFFFSLLILRKRHKSALLFLCLTPGLMATRKSSANSYQIINPGPAQELVKYSKNKVEFIDQRCSIGSRQILCKKKPSHLGGPSF